MPLLSLTEPPGAPAPQRFALWALGFRPFYLGASVFAALSIALWGLQFAGVLGSAYLQGPLWHAHEMLFGFALAVIVGFLFTAGRNWTQHETPTGPALMALAALWLAARVLVLTPWAWAAAAANVAFPLAAAVALAVPLLKARQRRNYFFAGLLGMLTLAAALFHLTQLRVVALPAWAGVQIALDVVLFIMAVMAGRVVPMFTNNGVPGAAARRHPAVEKAALGLLLALAVATASRAPAPLLASLAALAAVAHVMRWGLWQPWTTLRTPLVWVLHLAYLWVPVHLALRALAALGVVAPSTAVHALTVGAMGGLIIGMMTRTARGHTGRPLRADRFDIACYALVALAAAVRVVLPLVAPGLTVWAVELSALAWSGAFALYALRYAPSLWRARADGKPG